MSRDYGGQMLNRYGDSSLVYHPDLRVRVCLKVKSVKSLKSVVKPQTSYLIGRHLVLNTTHSAMIGTGLQWIYDVC